MGITKNNETMFGKLKNLIIPMLKCLIYVSVTFLFMISCGSAAQQQYKSHSVEKGETVYSIAKQYGISEATIYNLNPDAKNGLKINSVLIIPSNSVITSGTNNNNYRDHKVKKKETLYGIAQLYNVGVDEIKKLNKELYSRGLKKGEILLIPAGSKSVETIDSNTENILTGTQKYIVQAKETKFGIARKFGISIAELEDLNPDLDELKVGETLIVPDKTVIENAEIDDENFQYYEVKPKEGFFRLKTKFGLSEEEIGALNPYAKDGLKEGMMLKVLKDKNRITEEDISVIDLKKRNEYKKMKNVALKLTFRLTYTSNESTSDGQDWLK